MKFLAFSDLHGNLKVLEKFEKIISKLNFDLVVCAGDLLNYYLNPNELEKLPFYEEFIYNLRVPFLMVWGNRDFERFSNRPYPLRMAFNLDENDYCYKQKWRFTSKIEKLDSNSILVSHTEIQNLNEKVPFLQIWGDTHIAKILYRKHPCIDLGFLFRDEVHGSGVMEGLFWIIEISSNRKMSFNWYPLEKNISPKPFFLIKRNNGLDEYVLPSYLKNNETYIKKITGE